MQGAGRASAAVRLAGNGSFLLRALQGLVCKLVKLLKSVWRDGRSKLDHVGAHGVDISGGCDSSSHLMAEPADKLADLPAHGLAQAVMDDQFFCHGRVSVFRIGLAMVLRLASPIRPGLSPGGVATSSVFPASAGHQSFFGLHPGRLSRVFPGERRGGCWPGCRCYVPTAGWGDFLICAGNFATAGPVVLS